MIWHLNHGEEALVASVTRMSAYTEVLTPECGAVYVCESCELNVEHYVSPTLGRVLLAALLN